MKIKVQLLITFLFLCISGIAQNKQLTLSEPHPVVDYKSQYFQESENYIVSVKFNKTKLNIQSFKTSDLKEIGSNTYKSKDFDKNVEFEFFYEVDGKFYLLYSFLDRKTDTEKLLKREIDPKTAKFTNEGEVIISQKGQMYGKSHYYSAYAINKYYTNKYEFTLSETKKTLLVSYKLTDDENTKPVANYLHVFNNQFEKMWFGTYSTRDTLTNRLMGKNLSAQAIAALRSNDSHSISSLISVQNIHVKDNGDVYLFFNGRFNITLSSLKKEVKGNCFMFLDLGKKLKATEIGFLNEHYCSSFILDDSNSVMITGNYLLKNDSTKIGVYLFKIDESGKALKVGDDIIPYVAIDKNKINQQPESLQPIAKASLDKYYLKEAKTTKDNGVIIILESLYHTTLLKQDMSELHKHYYKDIIITKLNQNGELEWTHSIEKNQFSGYNNNRLSYKLVESQNAYNLLFIGHLKSKDIINSDPDHEVFHYDDVKGALYNVSISKNDGSISKKVLFDSQDVNGIEVYNLGKNRIVELKNNEIAIEVYKKGNEDVWVRIPLE